MRRALALALSVLLGLAGCGHVIIQTNDADARIFVDGVYLGTGEARYESRTGPPRTMEVTVKGSQATVHRKVSREFTGTTYILAAISLYTGFFWGWQYPSTVTVLLPMRATPGATGWDEAPSGWDAPPAGWSEPAAPTPAPAPAR